MANGISPAAHRLTKAPFFRPLRWLRPKYLLFGFIGLMLAYVLVHDESFLINAKDPEWLHIQSFRWWLLPHGLAGACALVLGPMQFSDRLRQRFVGDGFFQVGHRAQRHSQPPVLVARNDMDRNVARGRIVL